VSTPRPNWGAWERESTGDHPESDLYQREPGDWIWLLAAFLVLVGFCVFIGLALPR